MKLKARDLELVDDSTPVDSFESETKLHNLCYDVDISIKLRFHNPVLLDMAREEISRLSIQMYSDGVFNVIDEEP